MATIFIWFMLMAACMSGMFGFPNGSLKSEERSRREASVADLPQREVSSIAESQAENVGEEHKRFRRSFRSYYYNYFDEIAMSICVSVPSVGPGMIYAVRRSCSGSATCKDICTDPALKKQSTKWVQSKKWQCTESLHVYKRRPVLADNYDGYTDSHKIGLAVYRYNSCAAAGCGPNYCCCKAS